MTTYVPRHRSDAKRGQRQRGWRGRGSRRTRSDRRDPTSAAASTTHVGRQSFQTAAAAADADDDDDAVRLGCSQETPQLAHCPL